MGKTYKEQEERKALSKNHGKSIRYRIRMQEDLEFKKELAEQLHEEDGESARDSEVEESRRA